MLKVVAIDEFVLGRRPSRPATDSPPRLHPEKIRDSACQDRPLQSVEDGSLWPPGFTKPIYALHLRAPARRHEIESFVDTSFNRSSTRASIVRRHELQSFVKMLQSFVKTLQSFVDTSLNRSSTRASIVRRHELESFAKILAGEASSSGRGDKRKWRPQCRQAGGRGPNVDHHVGET
jgi:hypothetical protein